MKLTTALQHRIEDAWTYQAASSCGWAMSELNQFALVALRKGVVEVENRNGTHDTVSDLKTFLIWKNSNPVLAEIPVLRTLSPDALVETVNALVRDFATSQAVVTSIDAVNQRLTLKLAGQDGHFNLDLGTTKLDPARVKEAITSNGLTFRYVKKQHYTLSFLSSLHSGLLSESSELSFDVSFIEIR